MKATKKLIPALAMLVVSAVVMSSASYAWFTMSREVTANGLNVTVTAPNNLLIKGVANTGITQTTDTEFTTAGTNTVVGTVKINPASSTDGTNFFGLSTSAGSVQSTGALSDENSVLVNGDNDPEGFYVDLTYQVETTGNEAVDVGVKSVTVTRNGTSGKDLGLKAVRAAIITEGAETNNVLYPTAGNGAYASADDAKAGYWTSGKAVTATKAAGTAATLGDVNFATIGNTLNTGKVFQVAANSVAKDVTIRVWIEGEDQNCLVANAANLDFSIAVVLRDITYGVAAD